MKKSIIGLLIGVTLVAGVGMTTWGNRKTMINLEERVQAKYLSNQSNYDSMWKSMAEAVQITELQAEQFKDVYQDLIKDRNQDANLLFKVIHEQNPQMDTSLYANLQQNISDNRKVFDNNQNALLDIIREYNSYVRVHPITAWLFRCEAIDSSQYITTSSQTSDAFETKQADAIDLLNRNK